MLRVTPFWELVLKRTNAAAVRVMLGIESILPTGPADGDFLVGDGSDWVKESEATARASMGIAIGSNVQAWDTDLDDVAANITAAGKALIDDANAAAQRTTLALVIGTDVQAQDAVLDDLAGLPVVADNEFIVGTGAGAYAHEGGATARESMGFYTDRIFLADRNGVNQIGLSPSTFVKVQHDNEVFDPSGDYDNTTNYRYTPGKAGKYVVFAAVQILAIADGKIVNSSIFKNGSETLQGQTSTGSTTNIPAFIVGLIDMNGSTDYLEHFALHTDSVDRDIGGGAQSTFFTAAWIAE